MNPSLLCTLYLGKWFFQYGAIHNVRTLFRGEEGSVESVRSTYFEKFCHAFLRTMGEKGLKFLFFTYFMTGPLQNLFSLDHTSYKILPEIENQLAVVFLHTFQQNSQLKKQNFNENPLT